ncbi:hypothetical protein NKG94_20945 [Micromonospora sp. M12]
MSTLRTQIAAMLAALGVRVEIVDIGGRLYGDLTDLARDRSSRRRLVKLLAVDFGPRAQAAMQHVLTDPRFAPTGGATTRGGAQGAASLRTAGRAVVGILRALARPETARIRMFEAIEQLRVRSAAPADLRTAADRLRFVQAQDSDDSADAIMWPIVAGMLAATLPTRCSRVSPSRTRSTRCWAACRTTSPSRWTWPCGGSPRVWVSTVSSCSTPARRAGHALPGRHPARHRHGGLPRRLRSPGRRRGGPRRAPLAEDPAPVFAAVANYLRVTDPEQGPDRRFQRAATAAEAALAELVVRARRRRPVRAGSPGSCCAGRGRWPACVRPASSPGCTRCVRRVANCCSSVPTCTVPDCWTSPTTSCS